MVAIGSRVTFLYDDGCDVTSSRSLDVVVVAFRSGATFSYDRVVVM